MRLLILINLFFVGMAGSSRCIYQVRTRTVQPGGSVTIPCSYSTNEESEEDVQIFWEETKEQFCINIQWIVSLSGNVTEKYKGRLHREQDPIRKWTESITITGLKDTDGPRFCCQLYNIKHDYLFNMNTYGSLLLFSDEERVTQLDEMIAVTGEEVIIPCYYSKDNSVLTHVIWGYSDREIDSSNRIYAWTEAYQHDRYSLVNFTQDVSLRIQNIQVKDQKHYLCAVSPPGKTIFSKQRTKLIIADYQSSWDQMTKDFTVQEGHSVNLTCSYSLSGRYTERDVLRVNVYWRVGNVTGPYAYHPYQEMARDSTYVNRTTITGMTNLMINGVTKADNTSFHCFVVVKLCAGDNHYEDKIEYGGGTRLIINDGKDGNFTFLMIVIAVSTVTVLIILIGVLILLKMKGVICKKKPHFFERQMVSIQAEGDVACEETPYCEIGSKKPEDVPEDGEVHEKEIECGQVEEGEDGNLLYAELNKTKLKEKHPAELPMQNEEVLYAAVVNTTSS